MSFNFKEYIGIEILETLSFLRLVLFMSECVCGLKRRKNGKIGYDGAQICTEVQTISLTQPTTNIHLSTPVKSKGSLESFGHVVE